MELRRNALRVTTRRSAPPTAWSSSRRPHARHASRLGPPDARRPREPSPRLGVAAPSSAPPSLRGASFLAAFFRERPRARRLARAAHGPAPRATARYRLQDTVPGLDCRSWTAILPVSRVFLLSPPAEPPSLPRSNLPTGPEPTGPSSRRSPARAAPAGRHPERAGHAPRRPRDLGVDVSDEPRAPRVRRRRDGAAVRGGGVSRKPRVLKRRTARARRGTTRKRVSRGVAERDGARVRARVRARLKSRVRAEVRLEARNAVAGHRSARSARSAWSASDRRGPVWAPPRRFYFPERARRAVRVSLPRAASRTPTRSASRSMSRELGRVTASVTALSAPASAAAVKAPPK